MIDINNYNELKSRNLELGEAIVFPVDYEGKSLIYITDRAWLSPREDVGCPENQIFMVLQELGETKDFDTYLSGLYGYRCKQYAPDSSAWRDCNADDYAALSRVVYDIFDTFLVGIYKDVERIPLTNITIDFMNYGN